MMNLKLGLYKIKFFETFISDIRIISINQNKDVGNN